MTGRILVVDDVATNRIVMKVKLAAACYSVLQADCGVAALRIAKSEQPDLILLDLTMPDLDGVTVCEQLKADPETADIPVILITSQVNQASKMEGLIRGADDFLTKPIDEMTLLARVRSLLRAHEIQRELRFRQDSYAMPGLTEPQPKLTLPGKVALIAPDGQTGGNWKRALEQQGATGLCVTPRETALHWTQGQPCPDVFVIAADLQTRNEGMRLLSELRSRPGLRHTAVVMILPEAEVERGAVALDLGAGDILYAPFDPAELALRINTQLKRKRQSDRLRATVEAGLAMAVTDPLTGLHNRRYAQNYLARMAKRPIGRGLAVMMLDLDHFKQVNDQFGHSAGDQVLATVAARLQNGLRGQDLVARMGGEEFLIVLTDTGHDAALACAERLRRTIGQQPITLAGQTTPIRVTMSVGVAFAPRGYGIDAPDLITRADHALYTSKSDGRNLVSVSASAA